MFVIDFFKPRWRLQAENLFLRHQLGIALKRVLTATVVGGYDHIRPALHKLDGQALQSIKRAFGPNVIDSDSFALRGTQFKKPVCQRR